MHLDQLDIDPLLAGRLVEEQFPQWRGLLVEQVHGAGTVNAIFRIGSDLCARFPLRNGDPLEVATAIEAEAEASRELARCSSVPTPVPVAFGAPGHGYPLPWSVQSWLPGGVATPDGLAGSVVFAEDLAALVLSLRRADTRGRRFSGRGRGGALPDHDDWMELCFRESAGLLEVDRLRRIWAELRELPPGHPDVMSHGDLIPGNLLVRDDRLVGLLDGGGFGPADPSLDLVAAWHLLDRDRRGLLRDLVGCDPIEWRRGAAWAFVQAMGLVWYYRESNPTMSALGSSTLARIVEDAEG
jgi:aminoglycoside phosphotransferase (APT) family kinase protein